MLENDFEDCKYLLRSFRRTQKVHSTKPLCSQQSFGVKTSRSTAVDLQAVLVKTQWLMFSCQCSLFRSSPPEVFLQKGVLKICTKFAEWHPWRSVISIMLQSNFFKITLQQKKTYERLLLFPLKSFPAFFIDCFRIQDSLEIKENSTKPVDHCILGNITWRSTAVTK